MNEGEPKRMIHKAGTYTKLQKRQKSKNNFLQ